MEQLYKISIIMGVYNANRKNMIEESIRSIQNQTYTRWEMIICDDGSDDGTYEIISQWAKKEHRIKLIRNDVNRGLAFSLNHCLKYADGEFIARMDIDDISEPNRLECQLKYLLSNEQIAFCATSANLFDETGVWGARTMKAKPQREDFLFTSPFIHPTIMARKEFYLNYQYTVSRKTLRAEDYELFMRAYAKGDVGENITQPLYNFREDKDCYTRRKYRERWYEAVVRFEGFAKLGLLPKGIAYVVKPMIVGLIPQKVLRKIRRDNILY